MRAYKLMAAAGIFLVIALFIAGCGNASVSNGKNVVPDVVPVSKADSVELVYFHAKVACHCMAVVEENIKYAVGTNLQDKVASGRLKFTSIVSDDPANVEMVKKYDAMLFTLFIKEIRGNDEKFYPVSAIWNMTGDDNRDKLVNFITVAVNDILDGKNSRWESSR